MAVNVPQATVYLPNVSQHITVLRDAYQRVLNDNAYITAMGGATFLEAAAPNGLAMATADANALVAALGNLAGSNLEAELTLSQTMWGGG